MAYVPNWRFRVGNFYHKIDAQPMMQELQRDFGNVFLIREKIELPGAEGEAIVKLHIKIK